MEMSWMNLRHVQMAGWSLHRCDTNMNHFYTGLDEWMNWMNAPLVGRSWLLAILDLDKHGSYYRKHPVTLGLFSLGLRLYARNTH